MQCWSIWGSSLKNRYKITHAWLWDFISLYLRSPLSPCYLVILLELFIHAHYIFRNLLLEQISICISKVFWLIFIHSLPPTSILFPLQTFCNLVVVTWDCPGSGKQEWSPSGKDLTLNLSPDDHFSDDISVLNDLACEISFSLYLFFLFSVT